MGTSLMWNLGNGVWNEGMRTPVQDLFRDWGVNQKPGQALKRLGPHDLVTPVPGFEDQVFHLVLGPGQRSLMAMAGGKKEPILDSYFYENTCLPSGAWM